MQEVLREWVARTTSGQDGEDVAMEEEVSAEKQLEELKRCFEEFRPQVEGNAWCRTLLETL